MADRDAVENVWKPRSFERIEVAHRTVRDRADATESSVHVRVPFAPHRTARGLVGVLEHRNQRSEFAVSVVEPAPVVGIVDSLRRSLGRRVRRRGERHRAGDTSMPNSGKWHRTGCTVVSGVRGDDAERLDRVRRGRYGQPVQRLLGSIRSRRLCLMQRAYEGGRRR